jgi:hypothetical protein
MILAVVKEALPFVRSDFSGLVTDGDALQLIIALPAKVAELSGGMLKG